MTMQKEYIALIIFIITYTGIIFTRLPKINIDRPSAAFFGAVSMVVFNIISFQEAVYAVDYNTIALLLGMMIIVSTLQLDGFFSLIAEKAITFSKTPTRLLIIIVLVTGISSAFLVNDAVVLLFTPVIIMICRSSGISSLPFLIAEILSSNVGSAMSITGNPQNMLVGINSGISYGRFLLHLLPVSLIGMGVIIWLIRIFYPKYFKNGTQIAYKRTEFPYHYASMRFSVPIFAGVVVLFFLSHLLNLSIPLIALIGASLILVFGKIKPSLIIKKVDWVLLLFFASLFIVVHAFEKTGSMGIFTEESVLQPGFNGIVSVHLISLVMSQLVSNVPFAIIMLPILKVAGSDLLWLSLASACTLAGNATIIGAMANLIVIESAEKGKVKIRFWEFFKIGFPVAIITLLISAGMLYLQYLLGWLH